MNETEADARANRADPVPGGAGWDNPDESGFPRIRNRRGLRHGGRINPLKVDCTPGRQAPDQRG